MPPKSKPKSIPIPSIQDIVLFYTQTDSASGGVDGRIVNGQNNIQREHIIEFVSRLPAEYRCDPRWASFHQCFQDTVRQLSPFREFTLTVHPKGGRKYNYDFDFVFEPNPEPNPEPEQTYVAHIEFKVSSAKTPTIVSLPQIYQRPCSSTPMTREDVISYSAFYHVHYLENVWNLFPSLAQTPIPDLATYCAKTKNNTPGIPAIHSLKQCAKLADHNVQTQLTHIVNESISQYIETIHPHIDIDAVSKMIQETQNNKTYLMWSTASCAFYVDRLPPEELVIRRLERYTKNTLVFCANQVEYHFLLRWKNGKGICNPAWQVSVKKRGAVDVLAGAEEDAGEEHEE